MIEEFVCSICGCSGDDDNSDLYYCGKCGNWICLDCAIRDPDPAGEYLCEKCSPPQSIRYILKED